LWFGSHSNGLLRVQDLGCIATRRQTRFAAFHGQRRKLPSKLDFLLRAPAGLTNQVALRRFPQRKHPSKNILARSAIWVTPFDSAAETSSSSGFTPVTALMSFH
jgi:hypothetical protein